MFCPRCGRPVNTEANFCGGCGLSKVEIEKYLQKTQPQQPQNAVPQQEAPNTEPAFTQPPVAETPVQEAPKAESVFTEAETPAAEKTTMQEEASFAEKEAAAEAQSKAEYTAPNYSQYSYTSSNSTQNSYSQPNSSTDTAHGYQSQPEVKKEVPLSTVDFIWMLLISSLPLIGLVYIIYLAVQDNNINKRSFARANLIIALFSFVIAFVFVVGIFAANII